MNRWYNLAFKISAKSPHDKHRLGAVIVTGGNVQSIGFNTNSIKIGNTKWSKHAEERAILSRKFRGATLFVARNNGGMSRPCSRCMKAIIEAGISFIVYADWNGHITKERLH